MFQYNKECKTKTGEHLVPLTAEGDTILCATRRGTTVYRKLEDFDIEVKEKKKNIVAVPKQKIIKKEIIIQKSIDPIYIPPVIVETKPIIEPIKEVPVIVYKEPPKENEKDVQKITKKKKVEVEKPKVISKDNYEGDGYI